MASSPGSRTVVSIASPPKASKPCGPPSASAASTSPQLSEPPKPHRNFRGHVNSWRGIAYGQTAPLPQRLVILRPIRHTSLRPRNVVATVSIVFVRHEGEIRSIETDRLLRHPAHPCNTLARHRNA